MIPPFNKNGYLPPGIHKASLDEIAERFGWHVERWYAVGTILDSGHYRALTRAMVLGCKLAGSHAPFPRYLPDNDFSPG